MVLRSILTTKRDLKYVKKTGFTASCSVLLSILSFSFAFANDEKNQNSKEKVIYREINPNYIVYPDGAVKIVVEPPIASSTLVPDDNANGTASTIWNITLTIGSYFMKTAGNIIIDIATTVYGLTESHIAKNKGASVYLYHSYTYRYKDANVYHLSLNLWKTLVVEGNREWYRHVLYSFAGTDGSTYTDRRDYTEANGYPPIHIDAAPHYYDENWITQQAEYNYRMGDRITEEYGWR
ncbi:MAG: hypothetical protein ACPL3A_09560 [Thermoanaerobacteraceae bacterium]